MTEDDGGYQHHLPTRTGSGERRTRLVTGLTFAMMVVELVVGSLTGSMALTADGWHMATHAGALGLAAFAYWFARTQTGSGRFSFGTGKVSALAGYTNAVALALVALVMAVESVRRLWQPVDIQFGEAIPIALLGLAVNVVSALVLDPAAAAAAHAHEHHDEHHHSPGTGPAPHHPHHHHDHNLRAAYFHVLADALTSVLALVALILGRWLGWTWLDPTMGLVGGAVILRWGYTLCRDSARQLLDAVPSAEMAEGIRRTLEDREGATVRDMHLWEVAPGRHGCIVVLVTAPGDGRDTAAYRRLILGMAPLAHLTVEIHHKAAAV
jgi:cation diffusion facilitator family transporter